MRLFDGLCLAEDCDQKDLTGTSLTRTHLHYLSTHRITLLRPVGIITAVDISPTPNLG